MMTTMILMIQYVIIYFVPLLCLTLLMIKVREQDKEFASKVLEKARRKEQRKQQLAEQEREVRMFVTNNYYISYT